MLKSLFRKQPPLDAGAALQQAVAFHQQGRLDDAQSLYVAILDVQPGHFDARHLLGVLRLQQGRSDEAFALISKALATNPNSPEALANAGMALQALGRHDEAVASYDKAIAVKPDFADAIFNRGNALDVLGRRAEAVAAYDQALAINPRFAAALGNRGNVLQALNRHDEALTSYDAALALRPDDAVTLNNRGNAARALLRLDEALANFDRALAIRPDYAEAFNSRGNVLADQHRYAEAISSYSRALALRPEYADALNNRGNALHALGRDADAIADYDRALAFVPGHDTALYNRGIALHALGRHEEAIADYGRALAIRPDYVDALYNRGIALAERHRHVEASASFAEALAIDPEARHVLGAAVHARAQLCEWRDHNRMAAQLRDGVLARRRVTTPFPFLSASDDPALQLACTAAFAGEAYPAAANPLWRGERYAHERIRVAYLSANFHDHAVAYLIAELFERHDRERFEIAGISFGPDAGDGMRARLMRGMDRFIDVRGDGDAEAARLLRELETDIAVDLMGFTMDGRPGILAHRPAPIQVNYLGYPGTMGADYVDYIIADRFLIPPEDELHYSEKVVALPDSYQANDSLRPIAAETPARLACGLPETGFVFCCFNNSYKITPRVFDVWMRLLQRVEGAVLWLLASDPMTELNLRREARARGVDPARLVFAPRTPLANHLARHRLADLFVDTMPYNAHTTGSDALWAGLPLVTYAGRSFASRVAGSLLRATGLPELVTDSLAAYEDLSLALATDPVRLRELRERLAQNRASAPLFDTDRFRQHIEAAYITMHERHRRGETPAAFAVAPITI